MESDSDLTFLRNMAQQESNSQAPRHRQLGGLSSSPHRQLPQADAAAAGFAAGLIFGLGKGCVNPSRKEKNTSTAYPTRKAIARGEMEAPSVIEKLLNRPTTAPPMPAIRKRAQFARDDGVNVSALNCSSKERKS